jgi:hypothetical protein
MGEILLHIILDVAYTGREAHIPVMGGSALAKFLDRKLLCGF